MSPVNITDFKNVFLFIILKHFSLRVTLRGPDYTRTFIVVPNWTWNILTKAVLQIWQIKKYTNICSFNTNFNQSKFLWSSQLSISCHLNDFNRVDSFKTRLKALSLTSWRSLWNFETIRIKNQNKPSNINTDIHIEISLTYETEIYYIIASW